MNITDSVTAIRGIGEQRAQSLKRLGILTVKDLLLYYPRDYDDRSNVISAIDELVAGAQNTFRARVYSRAEVLRYGGKAVTKIKLTDGSGFVTALWYNQPYLKNTFQKGAEYIFTGRVEKKRGVMQVFSPEFEPYSEAGSISAGRIIPVYSTVEGINQRLLRSSVKAALDGGAVFAADFLPPAVRKDYCLCERNFAVFNIHFPRDDESFFIARRRLVFEELFLMQFSLLALKERIREQKRGVKLAGGKEICQGLIDALPFGLTGAQKRVFEEIAEDMSGGWLMNRLVQGDVGSGKTAVAMLASFYAIKNGYQAALMAPTEVLARQHMLAFEEVFSRFGIKTVLLTGGMKARERRQAYEAVETGAAGMIIGTHAVIQEGVSFNSLALAITDEQHRFGVRQRETLSAKGGEPHVLVMTATPIPRTLALILYGDLDISIIDELPPGRQPIETFSVTPAYHERIYGFIKKELDAGRQAYIICPMIEENDRSELTAALTYTDELRAGAFAGYSVECMHGKLRPAEKDDIMSRFAAGDINVLVSTTVIEVGVNVPNATVMLVENSERFGLAQLHQLRGRVGRGAEKSYCVLVCATKGKVAAERMKTLVKTSDGFEISEKDLKLRGPGDFFGTKQHGLPELKIANLYKDMRTLKEAQEAAQRVISGELGLSQQEEAELAGAAPKLYDGGGVSL